MENLSQNKINLFIALPEKPKVIAKEGNKAVIEISPCYPGYGVTLGNALRRVLLSSIEGAAITSVFIKGAKHEFSTLPGVLEDIIEIILNLKQLRFKLYGSEPQKCILKKKGEGNVTGSDIELPSSLELINKDVHIATITQKQGEVEMELTIERNIGYIPVEQRKKEKSLVGAIAIDAIFSPIKRVNYIIDNILYKDRTDYNRLKIDIETDGSISPEEAFVKACNILQDHYSLIGSLEMPREYKELKESKKKQKKDEAQKKRKKTKKGKKSK